MSPAAAQAPIRTPSPFVKVEISLPKDTITIGDVSYYPVSTIAKHLNTCQRTVRDKLLAGEMAFIVKPGNGHKMRLVEVSEFKRYLEAQ
jgi:hypothetical protein